MVKDMLMVKYDFNSTNLGTYTVTESLDKFLSFCELLQVNMLEKYDNIEIFIKEEG